MKTNRISILCFLGCFCTCLAIGQMPNTNIHYLEYNYTNGYMDVVKHIELTNGNGYNNQPSFSRDCKYIYFTSNRADSSKTDLYALHRRRLKLSTISSNALSEYSPTQDLINRNEIWHVRVETDQKQHLRKTTEIHGSASNMCLASDSVGYFALSDGKDIGLIILNKGLEFHTYALGEQATKLIRTNCGRFLNYNRFDNSYVFYGYSSKGDYLYRFDRATMTVTDSLKAISGCKDYGIDKSGNIFGGSEGKLYSNSFNGDGNWTKVVDLSAYSSSFYRLAFCTCGRHMCFVSYAGNKP